MSANWHLVTGEYPPASGGVGAYTAALADAMVRAGADVHVWTSGEDPGVEERARRFRVHRVRSGFTSTGLTALTEGLDATPSPRTLLVQYVPQAFGMRGMNLGFCRWVQHRARFTRDDVRIMFHEPFYPFVFWPPHRNVLAAANRLMAVLLLSDTRVAYVSTPEWERRLARYAPRARRFEWLPVPSTIPTVDAPEAVARWRARLAPDPYTRVVGHFGTYGELVVRFVEPAMAAILTARADARICLLGAGSEEWAARFIAAHPHWAQNVLATGLLPAAEISTCLQACDVMLQPYADGASGRRTTLMASLANGVATVTTRGRATEPEWEAAGAVAFGGINPTALGEAVGRLLDDETLRRKVAAAGHALYEQQFAMSRTIARLLARADVDAT